MKFVDYKFMILIGLSLAVYFLYREIEILNKRVIRLETVPLKEHTTNTDTKLINDTVPISNNIIEEQFEEQFEETSLNNIVELEIVKSLSDDQMVEEYSNDSSEIYSNNMTTTEIDTLMVDSLVNLVEVPQTNDINIPIEINTDNLVKHKLPELQEIANELNISLTVDGGNKKKTKQQLVQDITNKKNDLSQLQD